MDYTATGRVSLLLESLHKSGLDWVGQYVSDSLARGCLIEDVGEVKDLAEKKPRPPTSYRPHTYEEQVNLILDALRAMAIDGPKMAMETEEIASALNDDKPSTVKLLTPSSNTAPPFYKTGILTHVEKLENILPKLERWLHANS